jgi:hypothetical protein
MISRIQTILHQPELYCSPAFQTALAPAMAIPVLRLVFELMDIPTNPENLAKACEGQPKTVAEAITESLAPTVTMPQIPVSSISSLEMQKQKGGHKTRKFRQKRVNFILRQTNDE